MAEIESEGRVFGRQSTRHSPPVRKVSVKDMVKSIELKSPSPSGATTPEKSSKSTEPGASSKLRPLASPRRTGSAPSKFAPIGVEEAGVEESDRSDPIKVTPVREAASPAIMAAMSAAKVTRRASSDMVS